MDKEEIIIDKTTVWKTVAELRKGSLTKEGFIDLSKIKDLKVHNISKLVRSFRKELKITQRQCSKILGVACFANYESSNQAMPFVKLHKLSKLANFDIYKYLENSSHKFSFGTANEIPLKVPISHSDAIKLSSLFKPSKLKVRNILYVLNKDSEFLENFEIHLNKDKKGFIYSSLLWTYLTTYFDYIKKPLLNFPLTNIYSELKSRRVSDNTIIFSLLLTEGSKNYQGFNFSNKSKVLHDLLVDAINNKYKLLPTTYYRYVGDVHRTFFSTKQSLEIRDDIERYLGNIQTKPYKKYLKKFLTQKQPTISFIRRKQDMIALLRIYAVTEGSVYFKLTHYNKEKNEFIAVPVVSLTCSHPILLLDLYNVLLSLGFHPSFRQGKTWSGWAGLFLPSFRDSIIFLKYGGFLEKIPVARSDSIFCGIDKQILFLSIFELRRRMLNNKKLRLLDKRLLTNELFKIIKNIKYDSNINKYLELLKPTHTKRSINFKKYNDLKTDVNLLLDNPQEFLRTRN